MSKKINTYLLPTIVFIIIWVLLSLVQLKLTHRPIILLERFFKGGGWIEIAILATYGAVIAYYMQNPKNVPQWRKYTWLVFSLVFFSQLLLGLTLDAIFLMTGKLHLPIPMMILAGPIYREQLSIMTILFITTVILTGPAWCSHYCYFGAFDSLAAGNKKGKINNISNSKRFAIKWTIVFLVVMVALVARWLGISSLYTTIIALIFGIVGIGIMIFISRKYGKMIHCTIYCPIGTLVNIFKFANPFRMYIDNSCTLCMACSRHCKYDALRLEDIKNKKPGLTCTLCGDCIHSCHQQSIKYKLFKFKPETARKIYLCLTISLYVVFLALGRI